MGTNAEIVAQTNGLLLCEDCVESMEDERDAYEQERREEGVECVFDPERGFVMRRLSARRIWE